MYRNMALLWRMCTTYIAIWADRLDQSLPLCSSAYPQTHKFFKIGIEFALN